MRTLAVIALVALAYFGCRWVTRFARAPLHPSAPRVVGGWWWLALAYALCSGLCAAAAVTPAMPRPAALLLGGLSALLLGAAVGLARIARSGDL